MTVLNALDERCSIGARKLPAAPKGGAWGGHGRKEGGGKEEGERGEEGGAGKGG